MSETVEIEPKPNVADSIQEAVSMVSQGQIPSPEVLAFLSQKTPDEITQSIMENPPLVTRDKYTQNEEKRDVSLRPIPPKDNDPQTKPTAVDLDYAGKDISNINLTNTQGTEAVKLQLGKIQKFLAAPYISDGFSRHKDRWVWENTVTEALTEIDKYLGIQKGVDATDDPSEKLARSYAHNFKKKWDNNKFSRGMINPILYSLQTIDTFSDDPAVTRPANQLMERFNHLQLVSDLNIPREKVDQAAQIGRETIDLALSQFSKPAAG